MSNFAKRQLSEKQLARLQMHPIGLIILALSFLSLVIALVGASMATNDCASGYTYKSTNGTSVTVTAAGSALKCGKLFKWQWWTLVFQFVILVIISFGIFNAKFNKLKFVIVMYFAMASVMLMQCVRDFITSSQIGSVGFSVTGRQEVSLEM
jgi:hypothetical protein